MSPEPITAERTYRKLKQDIVAGRHKPGSVLNLHRLADESGSSVSPVRDAMQRLVGERLLEQHAGGGFEIPHLTADGLRDLYEWHGQVVRLALKHAQPDDEIADMRASIEELDPDDSFSIAQRTGDLFLNAARGSSNSEYALAIEAIGDRLFAARLQESLLKDRKEELLAVWNAFASGQNSTARDCIWAYHRRRIRRAPALLKALYAH